ncbi:MAG: hypothetical protein KC766_36085 [Myxococcales bacterium]|nr:hypothetical protein [Myxococcales bacterium]
MKLSPIALVSSALLIAPAALAQPAPEDAASASDASPATDATPETPTASPEVQKQVGMGTEKEDPGAVPPPPKPEQPTTRPESREVGEDDTFGHGMQVGLRGAFLGGYKMVFRYDQSPLCKEPDASKAAKDQQKFCGYGAQPMIDLAVSFAPLDSIEPFLWARFGLDGESQTNTNPLKVFGAGLRAYTMSDSRFKIFIEPAVGIESEDGAGNKDFNFPGDDTYNPEYKTDFVFHLAAGPQYDFAKAVGAYIHAGMTVGVLRSINATMEIGGGVQIRVP